MTDQTPDFHRDPSSPVRRRSIHARPHRKLADVRVLIALLVTLTGCIWEDVCVDGATRVDGRCVRLDDGGTTDAGPSDASADTAVIPDGCLTTTYYRDEDGDEVGTETDSVAACTAPEGYVPVAGDCDDTNDTVAPGATELCNYVDDDCDIAVDEGLIAPVGDPVDLGLLETSIGGLGIATFEAGYVVVWAAADGLVYLQPFTTAGVEARSAVQVADLLPSGPAQRYPELAVADVGGVPHALVSWQEDYTHVRVSSVRLDGAAAPTAATLGMGSGVRLATTTDSTVVVWSQAGVVTAVTLDPSTLAVESGPATLLSLSPPATFIMAHALTEAEKDYLVIGTREQRSGDTIETAYITLFELPGFERVPDDLRVRPDAAEAAVALFGVDGSPHGTRLGVYSTGGDPGAAHYFDLGLTGDAFTLTPALSLEMSGLPWASVSLPGGIAVAHSNALFGDVPGPEPLWVSQLVPPASGTSRVTVATAEDYSEVDLARHASGQLAVVYGATEEPAGGTRSTRGFLQRIGCE